MRQTITLPRHYILGLPTEKPLEQVQTFPGPPPDPPSPDFAASYAIFQEGHQAYRNEEYLRAAELFVRAGVALRVRSGIHAYTADRNRAILYENAAYAWLLAGAADTGKITLRNLARSGRASPDDVRRGLDVLAAPP